MLDAFYTQLFRPAATRPSIQLSGLIVTLVLLTLAFNAAGALHFGVSGLEVILLLFALAGGFAMFWLAAAVTFLVALFGGQVPAPDKTRETLYALLSGLWPLMLSGAAIAFQRLAPNLGMLFSLALVLGTGVSLTAAIQRTQALSWARSLGLLLLSLGLALGSLLGIVVWPLMLFLGL